MCVCVGGEGGWWWSIIIASVCIGRISCRTELSGDEEIAGNHCCCPLVVSQRGCLNVISACTARRALCLF